MEKKGIRMAASTILTTAIQEDTKTRIAYTTWISTKTNQRKIDNFAFSPSHSSSARFYVEQDVNEQNISFVYAINFSVETKIKRVNDVIWRERECVCAWMCTNDCRDSTWWRTKENQQSDYCWLGNDGSNIVVVVAVLMPCYHRLNPALKMVSIFHTVEVL